MEVRCSLCTVQSPWSKTRFVELHKRFAVRGAHVRRLRLSDGPRCPVAREFGRSWLPNSWVSVLPAAMGVAGAHARAPASEFAYYAVGELVASRWLLLAQDRRVRWGPWPPDGLRCPAASEWPSSHSARCLGSSRDGRWELLRCLRAVAELWVRVRVVGVREACAVRGARLSALRVADSYGSGRRARPCAG